MYMVYRVSMNRQEVDRGDNIIAIFARRGGAIRRLETVAHANPGLLYAIAILPEGAQPRFNSISSVYTTLRVDESEAQNVSAQ